jgi:hypothetical protein
MTRRALDYNVRSPGIFWSDTSDCVRFVWRIQESSRAVVKLAASVPSSAGQEAGELGGEDQVFPQPVQRAASTCRYFYKLCHCDLSIMILTYDCSRQRPGPRVSAGGRSEPTRQRPVRFHYIRVGTRHMDIRGEVN